MEIFAAFVLDLWLGDPVYRWHPIRLMGQGVAFGESILRRAIPNPKLAGGVLAIGFPILIFAIFYAVIRALGNIHPLLAFAAQVYGIYSALSIHDLRKEALQVYKDLGQGDRDKARRDLARIVGRDTQSLENPEIIRATVETVAESTLDGIVAPLFFAAIGGAPLALAYKAVNTLDSMVGHLNERYQDFGFVAAKQDEFWNWLPARISYYTAAFAAFFVNGRVQEALYAGWLHGVAASNGNGAIPEAAFAGALGVQLGGTSTYEGRKVEKPLLGFPKKNFDREDILKSIQLMTAASWISLIFAFAGLWIRSLV